ncbi:hypothetical protein [Wenzhouxiangella sediminis]|uniref:MSHA biogenesis protein MshP n=1 Tax=Wenzhouxiangella sediminis TaxID=1792836 RepID=A0A3E1KDS5_9GAMM|nr:hypothetical protein [Wenzhouxiangella sediminis]RFF32707.1 hypothetical protein DZC52_00875 [Wenzhouxiangella sediminis]
MIKIRQQRGAALFVGIFLITVVVLFAAVVALTSSTQHLSQARAGLAEQAWYAAVARIETAIQSITLNHACPAGGSANVLGYETFLACSETTVDEGGNSYEIYALEVTASRGSLSDPVFVRRSVRAQVVD